MPSLAVSVPPVQVVAAFGGVATVTPAGRLSVKSRPDAAAVLPVLSIVKVSVVTAPGVVGLGANAFEKLGGGLTTSMSVAVPLSPRMSV